MRLLAPRMLAASGCRPWSRGCSAPRAFRFWINRQSVFSREPLHGLHMGEPQAYAEDGQRRAGGAHRANHPGHDEAGWARRHRDDRRLREDGRAPVRQRREIFPAAGLVPPPNVQASSNRRGEPKRSAGGGSRTQGPSLHLRSIRVNRDPVPVRVWRSGEITPRCLVALARAQATPPTPR
jgi:hypothetical protein